MKDKQEYEKIEWYFDVDGIEEKDIGFQRRELLSVSR